MKVKILFVLIFCARGFSSFSQTKGFTELCASFDKEYGELDIPATDLDYTVNFLNIAADSLLKKQARFFKNYRNQLSKISMEGLDKEAKLNYKRMHYEILENLERLALEKKWNASGKNIPQNGLHDLNNFKDWYGYYVKHFTGVDISPMEVYKIGEEEVALAQQKIKTLQKEMGYDQEKEFYAHLNSDQFYLSSKQEILRRFSVIDSTVRKNLQHLFLSFEIPRIEAMEWPGSTSSTPPGIYLNKENNPYGVDVFQFNFSGARYNVRCMEWLYMHEAIPGHHLQSVFREAGSNYFYFGTVEGWACYVEDFGKELGLYLTTYSLLGKEEWNLVRSARLVMEVGIHYYGWTFERAMAYWKQNIKGQDDIAEREIRRITKWPGQSLCYKIGALSIRKIVAKKQREGVSLQDAHQFVLERSQFPLYALL